MAQIKITLSEPLLDGMDIKFQAPCDCTSITGLIVHYPTEDGDMGDKSFVFKDAHGNILTGLGNLFAKDAYVKVVVNVTDSVAYIQNADTNGYLESRLDSKMDSATGAASTIIGNDLAPSKALVSDANGKVGASEVSVDELEKLAGVNANVQEQLNGKAASTHTHSYLPLTGGTLSGQLKVNRLVLTNGVDYGTSLPSAGSVGRLFFKKVNG